MCVCAMEYEDCKIRFPGGHEPILLQYYLWIQIFWTSPESTCVSHFPGSSSVLDRLHSESKSGVWFLWQKSQISESPLKTHLRSGDAFQILKKSLLQSSILWWTVSFALDLEIWLHRLVYFLWLFIYLLDVSTQIYVLATIWLNWLKCGIILFSRYRSW